MKLRLLTHLLLQVLGQATVFALLHNHTPEAYYAAGLAVLGVMAAFFDTTYSAPVTPAPLLPPQIQ